MEIIRQRGIHALFAIAALAIFALPTISPVQAQPSRLLLSSTVTALPHYAQANRRPWVAVYTFNILNLGAAGYDATISNLFMTLLHQHRVLEVMNRKELEDSLRRAGLQQNENVSRVQKVGIRPGLESEFRAGHRILSSLPQKS